MKFSLKIDKLSSLSVDSLNLFVFEDELTGSLRGFPEKLAEEIKSAFKKEDFSGKGDDILVLSSRGLISAYKLIFTGLGKRNDFDMTVLVEQVAKSIKKAKENKAVKIALNCPDFWFKNLPAKRVVQEIVEAAELTTYRFIKYKGEKEKKKERDIEEIIISLSAAKLRGAEEGIKTGKIMSQATIFCRDLINEPPQLTTPSFLADQAVKIGKGSKGSVKVQILEKEVAEKLSMNAFLGVSRGSDEPPKFIILSYKPRVRVRRKIVVIGKGITFDTGGLSLKSPEAMQTMKLDMSGAAAVLGIFSAVGSIKPAVELTGIIPACENMPSGKALKPGDILKAYSGKTIEVLNTDAEGRLTLADALSYAVKRLKPDEIIDLATLTGACMVALGQDIAGLFGNNEKILEALEKTSRETGEKIWRMPLEKNYKELIKSHIADVKNIQTGRYGGAITAALFLKEFVENVPWAHLDMAGPAYMEKDTPLIPQGGAGFGVRLILHYINSI